VGEIVELVPEVQKDFHVRTTLAGTSRTGVLDLTDGTLARPARGLFSRDGQQDGNYSSKTTIRSQLDE
jgi:hypothetical protein